MLRREAPLFMLGMMAEAVAPHKGMGGGGKGAVRAAREAPAQAVTVRYLEFVNTGRTVSPCTK